MVVGLSVSKMRGSDLRPGARRLGVRGGGRDTLNGGVGTTPKTASKAARFLPSSHRYGSWSIMTLLHYTRTLPIADLKQVND